jgi:MFS-type transporter involved in bile tolerance (Atg22 family)
MSLFTAICFLTFIAIIEFEHMKRKSLFYCGFAASVCLILFVLCFNANAVYFACILAVISRVSFNISNLAFDSLLNAVSAGKDSHQISSRSFITGYVGMIGFAAVLLVVVAIIYFCLDVDASFILYGIAPNVSVGLWYLIFGVIVQRNFPTDCGFGPPFPMEAFANMGHLVPLPPAPAPASAPSGASTAVAAQANYVRDSNNKDQGRDTNASGPGNSSLTVNMYGEGSAGVVVSPLAAVDESTEPYRDKKSCQQQSHNGNRKSESVLSMNSDFENHRSTDRDGIYVVRSNNSSVDSARTGTTNTSNTLNTTANNRESYTLWGSIYWFFVYGLEQGTRTQFANLREFHKFPDLFLFIIAFIFIEGAQNTGVSLAAIIVVDIFSVRDRVIVACGACGLLCAILGLYVYKYLNHRQWITPKQILITNIVVFVIIVLSFLFINNSNASICFVIFAIVGGSQIGSVGAFARSIVASLCPANRQSRIFSLYQFCQVATAWIGPLLIASINSSSDGNSCEFLYLTVFVVVGQLLIGLPFLWFVNVERGLKLRAEKEEEEGPDI